MAVVSQLLLILIATAAVALAGYAAWWVNRRLDLSATSSLGAGGRWTAILLRVFVALAVFMTIWQSILVLGYLVRR